jgi:HEAT repeat protein
MKFLFVFSVLAINLSLPLLCAAEPGLAQQVVAQLDRLDAPTQAQEGPEVLQALVGLGEGAVPHLGEALLDGQRPWASRAGAAWALGELARPDALPWLEKAWALSEAPNTFRVQVAIALGALGRREPLRLLVQDTADKIVAAKAATAIANQRDRDAVPLLRPWLDDPEIGPFVALAAGRLGDPAARAALIPLLREKALRDYAAIALGELGDTTVALSLRFALENPDPFVRRDAAALLGRLGDVPSRPALEARRAKEQDPRVIEAIDRALLMLRRKERQKR